SRKYVGVIETAWHGGLCARLGSIKEIRRVYGYQHDVLTGTDKNLIHHFGVQRPRMVERAGLVGTIKKLWGPFGIAVEMLILQVCVIHGVKPEALLLGQVYIHTGGVLALVECVQLRGEP